MGPHSTIKAMLTPIPLPRAPEAAASLLSDALAAIAEESGSISRDAAVGAFRRHLARIQAYVQHAFEHEQITGLQAARLLGHLTDPVIGGATYSGMNLSVPNTPGIGADIDNDYLKTLEQIVI